MKIIKEIERTYTVKQPEEFQNLMEKLRTPNQYECNLIKEKISRTLHILLASNKFDVKQRIKVRFTKNIVTVTDSRKQWHETNSHTENYTEYNEKYFMKDFNIENYLNKRILGSFFKIRKKYIMQYKSKIVLISLDKLIPFDFVTISNFGSPVYYVEVESDCLKNVLSFIDSAFFQSEVKPYLYNFTNADLKVKKAKKYLLIDNLSQMKYCFQEQVLATNAFFNDE